MEFKLIELVLVLGALAFLWRSATRIGAQARAEKDGDGPAAATPRSTTTPEAGGKAPPRTAVKKSPQTAAKPARRSSATTARGKAGDAAG